MKIGAPRHFKRQGAPIVWKKEKFCTEKREKRQKKNCENY